MSSKEPMNLKIEANGNSRDIWLDETKLHHVADFKIESIKGNKAKLNIELLVNFPAKEIVS